MSTPQNGSVAVTVKPGAAAEEIADNPKVKAALEAAAADLAKKNGGNAVSVQVEKVGSEAATPAPGEQPSAPAATPAAPAAEQPADPAKVADEAASGGDEEDAEKAGTFLGLTGKEWIIASVGIVVGGVLTYALVKIFADGSSEPIDEGTGI